MAFLKVKNNARSTLANQITAQATSLTVASGDGVRFPGDNFHISIDDEVLLCTQRTNDILTVQRGREGTTPAPHAAGAEVQLRWTAAYVEELQSAATDLQNDLQSHIAAPIGGQVHPDSTYCLVELPADQSFPYQITNVRMELSNVIVDHGGNWCNEWWYNAKQSDSRSSAQYIKDATASFPQEISYGSPAVQWVYCEWASNAQKTQNTGTGYVTRVDSETLQIQKLSGADFGPNYYYWIRKRHYIVPADGLYFVTVGARLGTTEANKTYGVSLAIDGGKRMSMTMWVWTAGTSGARWRSAGIVDLYAGEILTAEIQQIGCSANVVLTYPFNITHLMVVRFRAL